MPQEVLTQPTDLPKPLRAILLEYRYCPRPALSVWYLAEMVPDSRKMTLWIDCERLVARGLLARHALRGHYTLTDAGRGYRF